MHPYTSFDGCSSSVCVIVIRVDAVSVDASLFRPNPARVESGAGALPVNSSSDSGVVAVRPLLQAEEINYQHRSTVRRSAVFKRTNISNVVR